MIFAFLLFPAAWILLVVNYMFYINGKVSRRLVTFNAFFTIVVIVSYLFTFLYFIFSIYNK